MEHMLIFISYIKVSSHPSENECNADNHDEEVFQYCLPQKSLNTCTGLPRIRFMPKHTISC